MTRYLLILALLSFGCSNTQPSNSVTDSQETSLPDASSSFILDEIIVKLNDGARLDEVLKDFEAIGLTHKEDIAPRSGLYLLTYDMEAMDAERILAHLKAHESILEAQFNKQLQERD